MYLCSIVFIKQGASSILNGICKYCDHCIFIHSPNPILSMVYHSRLAQPRLGLLQLDSQRYVVVDQSRSVVVSLHICYRWVRHPDPTCISGIPSIPSSLGSMKMEAMAKPRNTRAPRNVILRIETNLDRVLH